MAQDKKAVNIEHIIPTNYRRAFFFRNLGYLLADLVLFHYRKRNFLTIYSNNTLGTYIEVGAMEWARQNGKDIFSNEQNFAKFEKGFREVTNEAETYIAKAKTQTSATIADFYTLKGITEKLYYFFEKTEFFFTDKCYEDYSDAKAMPEVLRRNLLVLGDDLKMKSRPLLVELLTTILYHFVACVSQETGIPENDLRFYSYTEIERLLELGVRVDADIVKERQKSFVVYSSKDLVVDISGSDKLEILKRFKQEDLSQKNEFKGTIANKGKVTARARVVLPELNIAYEDFAKKLYSMEMNQGEILVTETTSPDFVPLMRKAGGIIANQGGLNSHAAIMSRELGVPCLVATYHATDILHTGDLIELDANAGIVKVIERV